MSPRTSEIPALDLSLPATSANLGPAFDAAALALDLHLKIHAERAHAFTVSARGVDLPLCGRVRGNLIIETYREVLTAESKPRTPLTLAIENEIPIGKGCGSSAAARLAGIALAVHFAGLAWPDDRIIAEAARREGHADNVAACWLGGLVLAGASDGVKAIRLENVPPWPLLLVLANDRLPTEASRAALPAHYSRQDAVANVQGAMALAAAYLTGDARLFTLAQQDRLHQPYRAALCPLLPCLQPLAGTAGILAVALSGAGGSVLLTLGPDHHPQQVRELVHARLRAAGLGADLIFTSMQMQGARMTVQPQPAPVGKPA